MFLAHLNLGVRDTIDFLNNVEVIVEDIFIVVLLECDVIDEIFVGLGNLFGEKLEVRLFGAEGQFCDGIFFFLLALDKIVNSILEV